MSIRLAVIGYGKRAGHIADVLREMDERVTISAITDVRNDEIRKSSPQTFEHTQFYRDPQEMLAKETLDGVVIGTRCTLHAPMACLVAQAGLPLFLEKPACTSLEQLAKLGCFGDDYDRKVVVSFPLRLSPLGQRVKTLIDDDEIGPVGHIVAHNYVPYGRVYYTEWFRNFDECGGMLLQKATHDLDFVNYVLDRKPVRVAAMSSRQVYGGTKAADLTCFQCDEKDTCLEGPRELKAQGDMKGIKSYDHCCLFAENIENSDNDNVLIEYEGGVQVSYTQNFFARRNAASRGGTIVGHKGTLRYDWDNSSIMLIKHHCDEVFSFVVKPPPDDYHFGGDQLLCRNFLDVVTQKADSLAPLTTGLVSAFMCIQAQKSANEGVFVDLVSTCPQSAKRIHA